MKIAFDIDGVLADNPYHARQVFDWPAFIRAISSDGVIEEGIALVRALYLSQLPVHEICFITGRPEAARSATREWLSRNCELPVSPPNGLHLYMRESESDQDPAQFRLEQCRAVGPDLVVEDDVESARLMYESGFRVLLFLRKVNAQ